MDHAVLPEFEIDGGRVTVFGTGALAQVEADADRDRLYLLDEGKDAWHTPEHRWGSGFLVTDRGAGRWNVPVRLEWTADGWEADYGTVAGLAVCVSRRVADRLSEVFTYRNATAEPVAVATLGIVTPFRDVYPSAAEAIATAVHAHVWPGGASAYVLAEPMSGRSPVLSLRVTEGSVNAYSIESRNHFSSSNVRGHLVLHAVDRRAPHAFGGQEPVVIAPGGCLRLAWTLGLHPDRAAAEHFVAGPLAGVTLVAEVGQPVAIATDAPAQVTARAAWPVGPGPAPAVDVARAPGGATVTSRGHGLVDIRVGADRGAVLFAADAADLVRSRVAYLLRHQRGAGRGGVDAQAFLPVDTETGLTKLTSGWPDWSDGAERTGMPSLLQQARLAGLAGAEVDEPLRGWARFARERLITAALDPLWGTDTIITQPRPYNSPWLAHFFADEFVLTGARAELDLAAGLLERLIETGEWQHLSIGWAEASLHVANLLADTGQPARAEAIRASVVRAAAYFADLGARLPAQEVRYEQAIVAPLVSYLAAAHRLTGDDRYLTPLATARDWLLAFNGPQPHPYLHEVAIRHWDGFWFGALRLWGDTFPHYWSVLTGVALAQLPEALRTPRTETAAPAVFAANLGLFAADGSATCAFLMPSAVDGRPAHRPDPLANDQDWALTLYLRHHGGRTGWPVARPRPCDVGGDERE
ncbi:MAG: hypothetical protein LBR33_01195 [Propionibacteriaceae bacterium]|nr:hypothetical protein [Propionibacteriaceae bacterium]